MRYTISIIWILLIAGLMSFTVTSTPVPSSGMTRINVDGRYSIEILDYLESTTELQSDASLQYQHYEKEHYITVLEETQEEALDYIRAQKMYVDGESDLWNYSDIRYQLLVENGAEIIKESKRKKTTINGLEAYSQTVVAKVVGIDENITYFFTFIEGKENFYMVCAWTLTSRQGTYKSKANKMVRTFKEL